MTWVDGIPLNIGLALDQVYDTMSAICLGQRSVRRLLENTMWQHNSMKIQSFPKGKAGFVCFIMVRLTSRVVSIPVSAFALRNTWPTSFYLLFIAGLERQSLYSQPGAWHECG